MSKIAEGSRRESRADKINVSCKAGRVLRGREAPILLVVLDMVLAEDQVFNAKLSAKIREQMLAPKKKVEPAKVVVAPDAEQLDIRQILNLVPHRYPFALVDRVLNIDHEAQEITAVKNVTINEPFFQGHFPGNPVMPGVLQLEAMAQVSGLLLLSKASIEGNVCFFMSADKVKFRKPVMPGDQVIISAKITKNRGNKIVAASAECRVGEEVVSSADVMFTLTPAPKY